MATWYNKKYPVGNKEEVNKMDGNILKSKIILTGKSINEVIKEMNVKCGITIGRTTFYRKMHGVSEFNRREILALTDVLNLTDADVMHIFFDRNVS